MQNKQYFLTFVERPLKKMQGVTVARLRQCKIILHVTMSEKEFQRLKFFTDVVTCKTRCSAIAERPRCRVRYSFRQK